MYYDLSIDSGSDDHVIKVSSEFLYTSSIYLYIFARSTLRYTFNE